MAQTTNYNIQKPDVGASENTWGSTINTAFDLIDTTIKTVSDTVPTTITSTTLTDTPSSLGTAKQVLRVNSGATATEFATPSIIDLSDTPSALGTSGQILKMNSGGTALEWGTDASGGGGITLTEARNGISVTQYSPSGGQNGQLAYTPSTGNFSYVPPDLSGYASSSNGTATRSGYVQGYVSNTAFNGVGTYIFAQGTTGNTSTEYDNGIDVAGSSIYPSGAITADTSGGNVILMPNTTALGTGTWKCMGQIDNASVTGSNNYMAHRTTLWLRII
tara:strand:- start:7991 stop:8818 length:828 start_codon:yes stop_codon:yes gene_type:complete